MRRTATVCVMLALIPAIPACQQPATSGVAEEATVDGPQATDWTQSQRDAFGVALASARDKIYRQLRVLRIRPGFLVEQLIAERMVSVTELRGLAASARIRRVTWIDDGGCRVELALGLPRVVEAVHRWDVRDKYAPHGRIAKLAGSHFISAVGDSTRR